MVSPLQIEFEKKLLELGLSYSMDDGGLYSISSQRGGANHLKVQLILALPSNKQVHGSKNGNVVQAIGIFKFKFLASGLELDILVFTFQNTVKNQVESLIIPTQEFVKRHVKFNSRSIRRKRVEMVFWLMEDGFVYDTTNISPEGEWYYISNGINGRMADGTDMDYTGSLNNWQKLKL